MKKYIYTAVLALAIISAKAQIEEEAIFLTGGLTFNSADAQMDLGDGSDMLDAKNTIFSINVGGGYMFTDQFGAGLKLGYTFDGLKADDAAMKQTLNVSIIDLAPFLRYYLEIDDPLFAVFEFNAGFGFGNNKIEQSIDIGGSTQTNSVDQKFTQFNIGISPGFTYFLSDNFAVEMWYGFLGYAGSSQKATDNQGEEVTVTSGSFGLGFDLNTLQFGIIYVFNN